MQTGVATIELFQLGSDRHPDFQLPVLLRPPLETPSHTVLHSKVILFSLMLVLFNLSCL